MSRLFRACGLILACALSIPAAEAPKDDDARMMKKFIDAYKILEQNTADPFDLDKAFYEGAIPGLLRHLDPHSVFFDPGQAELKPEGMPELDKVASAMREIIANIPPDIPWVLRVDGHTDKRPLSGTGKFATNWDLSAARAIAVVRYLQSQGLPPEHLLAAGFGEFQPLDLGDTEDAFKRNRRIELKLTDR